MANITIRAFNKDGYYKDILVASDKQVYKNDVRISEPLSSCLSGLIGHGGRIEPSLFPEVEYFELIIESE